MAAIVRLVREKDSYCVRTYLQESDEDPTFLTDFPYNSEDEQAQLEEAISFWRSRGESLDAKLETLIPIPQRNLQNPQELSISS